MFMASDNERCVVTAASASHWCMCQKGKSSTPTLGQQICCRAMVCKYVSTVFLALMGIIILEGMNRLFFVLRLAKSSTFEL